MRRTVFLFMVLVFAASVWAAQKYEANWESLDKRGIDIFREVTFFQAIGMIFRRPRKED